MVVLILGFVGLFTFVLLISWAAPKVEDWGALGLIILAAAVGALVLGAAAYLLGGLIMGLMGGQGLPL